MSIHYVRRSFGRPAGQPPAVLDQPITVELQLWAEPQPIQGVAVHYVVLEPLDGSYSAATYQVSEGDQQLVAQVTGTEATPQKFQHVVKVSGKSPPPAFLRLGARIRKDGVTRRGTAEIGMVP